MLQRCNISYKMDFTMEAESCGWQQTLEPESPYLKQVLLPTNCVITGQFLNLHLS